MNRLSGKVAIITGAAGGIGEAIVRLFVAEGAKVMATDTQYEKLKNWALNFKNGGGNIEYLQHDIAVDTDWKIVIYETISAFGKIDILVNNAGVYSPGANMDNTTLEEWNKLLSINLNGAFIGTGLCVPHMHRTGGGAIVNISSIAGLVGGNGPAYTASKGALRLLTKDNAIEFAKYNIRVNSIHPGGVLTPMTEFLVNVEGGDELVKNMCPMGRIGRPEEIACGALYLASEEASYVTGAELVIDGGLTAR